jgi:flagellar biosynthesis protein FlhF
MRLKSYFSGTVEAAIDLARRELGEDALLVNARPSTPETRSLGAFEVVFGVSDNFRGGPVAASAGVPSDSTGARATAPPSDRLAQEVADLKRQLEKLGQSLRYGRTTAATGNAPDAALLTRLLEAELEPMLAQQVAQGTRLEDLFEVEAALGRRPGTSGLPVVGGGKASAFPTRMVVAFIGPPGAGKTTTLVKLAARYGLTSRRPSHILSIDVNRIAAADQLRTLAGILGIGYDVVETPTALDQAIEEHRNKDFIFIDTPGYAAAEMDEARELAMFFAGHPEMDTHLVVPASMRPCDLGCVMDRYEMFSPHKLLFTKMDETDTYGPLINESARRLLPISYLATGQGIPDDLEPATKHGVAALVRGAERAIEHLAEPIAKSARAGAAA